MPNGTCSLSFCDSEGRLTLGMCTRHYRLSRKGLPLDTPPQQRQTRTPGQKCSVDGCDRDVLAKGFCSLHWRRAHRGISFDRPVPQSTGGPCAIDDCEGLAYSQGWCSLHYQRWLRHGDPLTTHAVVKGTCSHPGCARPHCAFGYCNPHARRWRLGHPLDPPIKQTKRVTAPCAVDGCDVRGNHFGLCRRHHDQKQYAANPERFKAAVARRRYLCQLSDEERKTSVAYREAIAFDPCAYCGAPNARDVDHIFPLAKGGTDHWWNLTRACEPCNVRKSAHCGTWWNLKRGSWLHVTTPRCVPAVSKAGSQHRRKSRKADKLLVRGGEIGQNYSLFDLVPDYDR